MKKLFDGNRMKLMLAAVLARDTELLIPDEQASPPDPLMLDKLCDMIREYPEQTLGNAEDAARFENITIPARTYVVCETEQMNYPAMVFPEVRKRIVEEWLPSSGYMLAKAPEISVPHWFRKPEQDKRYIELWLPVEKGGNG